MKKIAQKHGGKINRIEKGEVLNPHGRPRKYISLLKGEGFKLNEIHDCIMAILSMNEEELKAVFENPNATVLEKTIAKAINTSIAKGSLDSIETLITRAFGRPKENIDVTSKGESIAQMPDFSNLTYEQLYQLKYGRKPD